MKLRFAGGTCAAAVVALGMAVFSSTTVGAQDRPAGAQDRPAPAQERTTPAQPQAAGSAQQVTVTGCIQREADYRKARDAGRGGVANTGVGAGNEFILAEASMPGAGATSTRGAGAPAPAATTGGSVAYELSGRDESKAEQFVGKRVEIAGMLKAAEIAGGRPTGGPTAGKPPEGIDVAGRDLQLRELEISSIREVSGTCAK
ncbi:MAG TPA: hypothetical protein VFO21_26400 [Vicinamibacterales bacterium]|nr:hypothetical protein [Vicinamibacterales bacterium]